MDVEVQSRTLSHFQKYYKKFLIILSSAVAIYFLNKYMYKYVKIFGSSKPKKKPPLKDFPTIEDIQKFIEDLPFDAVKMDKSITLKDLLGELSDFSEDEEWKELIASVHNLYNESPSAKVNVVQ